MLCCIKLFFDVFMVVVFSDCFSDVICQFVIVVMCVNWLVLENVESMFGVQLKVMECNLIVIGGWLGELVCSDDVVGMFNKGVQLWQDNLQWLGWVQQDVVGFGLQVSKVWFELVQGYNELMVDVSNY